MGGCNLHAATAIYQSGQTSQEKQQVFAHLARPRVLVGAPLVGIHAAQRSTIGLHRKDEGWFTTCALCLFSRLFCSHSQRMAGQAYRLHPWNKCASRVPAELLSVLVRERQSRKTNPGYTAG
jgi:hypothetical protein